MLQEKNCITINCNCCKNEDNNNQNVMYGTPIGTVIAYMGTKAPEHYLVCDGTELNITDYKKLADQILDEFGLINYFGGDGTNSFMLPDLRNEFLRGYHGTSTDKLTRAIGKHQEPTTTPLLNIDADGHIFGNSNYKVETIVRNIDNKIDGNNIGWTLQSEKTTSWPSAASNVGAASYRPTNVAVLYCIKYE